MPGLPPWPYPPMAAHRGAGRLAPENTLAALRFGRARGYRMAEIDVKSSRDGVSFLLHDDTLDRTTDGSGPADALAWRELALLDAGSWHSAGYAGEPLASLRAVALYCRANDMAVNVEIKPVPGHERETGTAVARDARALWAGAAVPPLLSSFSVEALDAARAAAPELPRAWLVEDPLPSDWRAEIDRLRCVAFDAAHALLTRDFVRALRDGGLRVAAWTVNEPARAAELAAWGVDTIITDAVDAIAPDAFGPAR